MRNRLLEVQRQSLNGMLKYERYSYSKAWKVDGYETRSGQCPAIGVKLDSGRPVYIPFHDKAIRDMVFAQTIDPTVSAYCIRLYQRRKVRLTDNEAKKVVKKLGYSIKYLTFVFTKLEKAGAVREELDSWQKSTILSLMTYERIKAGQTVVCRRIEEEANLFGSSLPVPKKVLLAGVTPEQFYKAILE